MSKSSTKNKLVILKEWMHVNGIKQTVKKKETWITASK
jgi:hypothetical protein